MDELAGAGPRPRDVYALVVAALDEDLPTGVDVTSAATIPADARAVADFGARGAGVVAGLGVAELALRVVLGDDLKVEHRRRRRHPRRRWRRGDARRGADPGAAHRRAHRPQPRLPPLGRGHRHVALGRGLEGTRARVLDTRKTLPGLRALQKYAVRCGGGVNHRFSLGDMAMVKDNHVIAAGGVVPAYEAVRAAYPDLPVEVEVTDLDQLRALLDAGCDRILLDNMDSPTMAEAVRITGGRASLEASGGLTLERAREVAETGVDFISVGALTHSVVVFDLGMDLGSDEPAGRRHRQQPHGARPSSTTARSATTGGWPRPRTAPPTSGRC